MTIPAFPLQWPDGWKRTEPAAQAPGRFGVRTSVKSSFSDYTYMQKKQVSIAEAVSRIRAELGRMGLRDDDIVISSNLRLRLDGLPRSDQREPDDSGAAVYWIDKGGATRCMAIDRYRRVADNLAAIAATLDAMRAIERHGGAEILNRAFTGFAALEHQGEDWWDVLEVRRDASREAIDASYRRKRSEHHPDKGGDSEQFQRVQRAYEAATK